MTADLPRMLPSRPRRANEIMFRLWKVFLLQLRCIRSAEPPSREWLFVRGRWSCCCETQMSRLLGLAPIGAAGVDGRHV
jgi:hypothetical protein